MRAAFKEWAIIVDALGRGEQIVILRKGGLSEAAAGFQVEHEQFWLFPTLFHQQRLSVLPHAQSRFDELAPLFCDSDQVFVEYFARVNSWHLLPSLEAVKRLRGQHIWRDEVIMQRFDWGKNKNVFSIAVRVFRLPEPVRVPILPSYGGCKSWIELGTVIPTLGARPVLSDEQFDGKVTSLRTALNSPEPPTE